MSCIGLRRLEIEQNAEYTESINEPRIRSACISSLHIGRSSCTAFFLNMIFLTSSECIAVAANNVNENM